MLDRGACERRVYRLATLLTGNPNAATKVIKRVLSAQPDLAELDSAHMDRLTVLRSRELRPAALVSELVAPRLSQALARLPAQQREAWVFARVYATPEREMSRAMDCSVTATQRHLEQAEQALEAQLGPAASEAAPGLLRYSMTLDVPEFYRQQELRRRRIRLSLKLAALAAAAALLGALILFWTRPFSPT